MSLDTPEPTGLSNDFATIPDVSVESIADRVAPRQVSSGVTRGIQQLGSDKVYSDGGNNQIIVEDSSNPRVLMGDQATFGEGFYVTKDGFDVKTNTDPANFIFNSNQNVFKIIQRGTATVIVGSGHSFTTRTTTVAHGLSATPIVMAFVSVNFTDLLAPPAGRLSVPYTIYEESTVAGFVDNTVYVVIGLCSASADATNIYFTVGTHDVTFYTQLQGTYDFTYYILQETAT